MDTGAAIRMIREGMDLSQKDLAIRCSFSQSNISRIESGSKRLKIQTIDKICTELGIPQPMFYVMAIEECDVAKCKRHIYRVVHPEIRRLALTIAFSFPNEKKNTRSLPKVRPLNK